MKFQVEEILDDLKLRMDKDKSIINKVFLETAIQNLQNYHEETKRKMV